MSWVILTGRQSHLDQAATPHKVITNRDYLAHPALFRGQRPKVINLSNSYAYQSRVVATTEVPRALPPGSPPPISQDGYGLISAGVVYKPNDSWTFSLQGTNLADEKYLTTGYNIPALYLYTGFYGPPRQYSLSARYDF